MSKSARATPPAGVEILTAEEVSRWLRIPKSTLYKLCNERRVPARKVGRHWRFDRVTIAEWLRRGMATREGQS
ncbi:MAG: helix-turn-helix domain-containing protein [Planctomycetes bacterium]|nr:helix-turn-helix domain-containing protein [Planctomycetota bacterium]